MFLNTVYEKSCILAVWAPKMWMTLDINIRLLRHPTVPTYNQSTKLQNKNVLRSPQTKNGTYPKTSLFRVIKSLQFDPLNCFGNQNPRLRQRGQVSMMRSHDRERCHEFGSDIIWILLNWWQSADTLIEQGLYKLNGGGGAEVCSCLILLMYILTILAWHLSCFQISIYL